MLSERTLINGLILIAGMILGPYLITLTFEFNQLALLSFASIAALFVIFFFAKDRISVLPFMAGSFSGNLNVLPFGLTLVEVFSLVLILYFLVNYVALNRRPLNGGPRYFLFPMLVIAAIVLYHDHKISLHALGGVEQGSRPGLLILLAIVAYVCGINMACPPTSFLKYLPCWCFLMALLGSLPFILTTYFPSTAPYIINYSGNINLSAYIESVKGGDVEDTGRNGSFLGIATTLQGLMVAYFPVSTWWRPSRWILLILSLLCLYGILMSGYRNALLTFVLISLLGAVCYSRMRLLLMMPLLALVPLALMLIQNNHIAGLTLPDTVQRTMSFLPGEWDSDVKRSAESSNEFRADITRVYMKEYLDKSPWIGNGFAFNPRESEGYEALAHIGGSADPSYFETKAFLVSKNFHIGWISLYDAVGIIGGIAFVILNVALVGTAAYFVFKKDADMNSSLYPTKVWLFCNLFAGLVGYFTTFGAFNLALVGLCCTAIVLVHLGRLDERSALKTVTLATPVPTSLTNRSGVTSLAKSPLS